MSVVTRHPSSRRHPSRLVVGRAKERRNGARKSGGGVNVDDDDDGDDGGDETRGEGDARG